MIRLWLILTLVAISVTVGTVSTPAFPAAITAVVSNTSAATAEGLCSQRKEKVAAHDHDNSRSLNELGGWNEPHLKLTKRPLAIYWVMKTMHVLNINMCSLHWC